MSSYKIFVSEPMRNKLIMELGGIGRISCLAERLWKAGFDKAYKVFGKYLILDKDEKLFENWLINDFQATPEQATTCYECLRDWSVHFWDK